MDLSIVIPCYNGEGTIARQLEALGRQEWDRPWEVIVADNGSTDLSRVMVARYMEDFPNFRLVDASQKRGQGFAKNVGVRCARSEHIAFCDADDEVGIGWVAAIGRALGHHTFVASRMDVQKLNKGWAALSRNCHQTESLREYLYPPYLSHAAGCGLGVWRSLHDRVGGFDERLSPLDDTDYCWRIQLSGTNLVFVPEAVIHYRYRDTLPGLFVQMYAYGKLNVALYKKYRNHGMPKITLRDSLMEWGKLIAYLPRAGSDLGRAQITREAGTRLGRLVGSIKYKTLAF